MNFEDLPNVTVHTVTLDDLCEKIFNKPPSNPGTCPIGIEESCQEEIPDEEQGMYIFDLLSHILLTGIRILFGTNEDGKVVLSDLTLDDFQKLRKYMQSMCFDMEMVMYEEDEESPNDVKFDPKDYTTIHLKFKTKNDQYVEIGFKPYKPEFIRDDHFKGGNGPI